jgi:hypothetical protein
VATEFHRLKLTAFGEASKFESLDLFWGFDGGITAEVLKKLDFIGGHEEMPENAKMRVSALALE